MRKIILASHGSLAEGMKSAVNMILGNTVDIEAFGLDQWGTPQAIQKEVRKRMSGSDEDEYVILCDVKGGSAYNSMVELVMEPNVSIISGMNLNLVLDLALMSPDEKLKDVIEKFMEEARQGIEFIDASEMNEMKKEEEEDELW